MTPQHAMTLLTPIASGQKKNLEDALLKLRCNLDQKKETVFERTGTIHYARWFILTKDSFRDKDMIEGQMADRLVFSSNHDGTTEEQLHALAERGAQDIDMLYQHCEGYPEPADRNTETRKKYLRQWYVPEAAFFIGAPGRSLTQVLQEDKLRDTIWEIINRTRWGNKTAQEIHRSIRQEIESMPEFQWSKEPIVLPRKKWGGMAILVLVILILLVPFVIPWLLILHFFHEKKEVVGKLTLSRLDGKKITELEEREDLANQNQFTQAVVMKPGKMRLMTTHMLMLFARTLIKVWFTDGELMGIPTIHFARWVLIDKNKNMLFFSNFDGSWQQYLGDFIDKSGWGLTGIFSNTVKFPPTRFLFWGGAYDEEHFLAWSRSTQIPTNVWYCAYPHLSIKNVNNNSAIRHLLYRDLNEKQAGLFLRRF